MKIILVDKYNKNHDIVKKVKDSGIENIEIKDALKSKTTKNDIVILFEDSCTENLSKTSKVIWITREKETRKIWSFIHMYNCIDVIDSSLERDYIVKRVIKNIA